MTILQVTLLVGVSGLIGWFVGLNMGVKALRQHILQQLLLESQRQKVRDLYPNKR